jgi:hypothetical protein
MAGGTCLVASANVIWKELTVNRREGEATEEEIQEKATF